MWTNDGINLYFGDCRQGDRAATDAEIAAWNVARAPNPVAVLEAAVQAHLDQQAQAKGYDNIVSACSYAATPNAFQAESISFLNWRAACWSYCYTLEAEVQAGTAQIPTPDALIAALPARV
jgi:hypothetical protein